MSEQTVENTLDSKRSVVVVGDGADFSQNLVEYALWFAKRLEYDIVALSCVEHRGEATEVLELKLDELSESADIETAQGVKLLACRAIAEGLSFQHLVKHGSQDHCIRETFEEIENIDYVITEPEEAPPQEDMEHAMPVFSIAR